MAKIAAALREGFRLSPATVRDRTVQRVYAVTLDTPQSVTVFTDDGIPHSFGITEPVVFPRRQDGHNEVINLYEEVQVRIDDIFPGDLMRPIGYQGDGQPALHEAWLVKSIFNAGDGWVVYGTTEAGDGKPVVFFVPATNDLDIYAEGTKIFPPSKEDLKKSPRASGWYLDTTKDEKVRFRLPGIIGRPPARSRQAMDPGATAWWARFELIDGETPHPSDPRFSEPEVLEKIYGDVEK